MRMLVFSWGGVVVRVGKTVLEGVRRTRRSCWRILIPWTGEGGGSDFSEEFALYAMGLPTGIRMACTFDDVHKLERAGRHTWLKRALPLVHWPKMES